MKLCADILYWRLKEELKAVELHGAGSLGTDAEPPGILSRPDADVREKPRLRLLRRPPARAPVAA